MPRILALQNAVELRPELVRLKLRPQYQASSLGALAKLRRTTISLILCFVDRASLYNLVNKANLVQNFS